MVGSLDAVTAPPYDVIDDAQRAALAAKSPFNVVEIDLPRANGGDPYLHAQTTFEAWQQEGVLVREREPAIWALTQDYTGPDGQARTRHGFLCRVRGEDYGPGRIRPHERTHPGPKEDRLRLTRATRANLSPIFSLFPDPEQAAWHALEPHTRGEPFGSATDADGTLNRIWRISDPGAIASVQDTLRDRELLRRRPPPLRTAASTPRRSAARAGSYVLIPVLALGHRTAIFATSGNCRADEDSGARLTPTLRGAFASRRSSRTLEPAPGRARIVLGYLDHRWCPQRADPAGPRWRLRSTQAGPSPTTSSTLGCSRRWS